MILSRSAALANFAPSKPIFITEALCVLILLSCAYALRRAAETARDEAKKAIANRILQAKGPFHSLNLPHGTSIEQLEALLARVDNLKEGAFSPISQQPPIRALLLPLSSIGWTLLLQYKLIPGL